MIPELTPGDHYVAMGSSFAAGPGMPPRSPGSPRSAGRSSINYAHLLAPKLALRLTDVSCSGWTAAQIANGRRGKPPQTEALTARTKLVTITAGGNDVGYIPRLILASLPRPAQKLSAVRRRIQEIGEATEDRFAQLATSFEHLLVDVRQRAPQAAVVLVDYLTVLPPPEEASGPLTSDVASWGRQTADRLAVETARAAVRAGCHYLAASAASQHHHAWSVQPWTRPFRLSRRDGAAYHPNAAGMRAVADLLAGTFGRGSADD